MLIQSKELKTNDVVTIKFIGGDEILGRVIEDQPSSLSIRNPMVVMMAQEGFGLMPYILTLDPSTSIDISKTHIITYSKTLDGVAKEYIKQTTGLFT